MRKITGSASTYSSDHRMFERTAITPTRRWDRATTNVFWLFVWALSGAAVLALGFFIHDMIAFYPVLQSANHR